MTTTAVSQYQETDSTVFHLDIDLEKHPLIEEKFMDAPAESQQRPECRTSGQIVLQYTDKLTRLILYAALPLACTLYMSLNREALCNRPILSKIVPPTVAAYCTYAIKSFVIENCIDRVIHHEGWKDFAKTHYNLVWALLSSWFIANIFSSLY